MVILVPRAYDPSGLRQESRALGATISGMRHRCRCAVSRITRIRLFPLFFHNGCSQSSRFLPQARRIVGSGVENELWSVCKICARKRECKKLLKGFPHCLLLFSKSALRLLAQFESNFKYPLHSKPFIVHCDCFDMFNKRQES